MDNELERRCREAGVTPGWTEENHDQQSGLSMLLLGFKPHYFPSTSRKCCQSCWVARWNVRIRYAACVCLSYRVLWARRLSPGLPAGAMRSCSEKRKKRPVFNVCGSVHHASVVLIIQQDATSKWFILHFGYTLHVSGDNPTHHQEYYSRICDLRYKQVTRYVTSYCLRSFTRVNCAMLRCCMRQSHTTS